MSDAVKPVLEARDLSLRAGDRVLLEHASFAIRPGDLALLIGPSGSGKSLLLQILAGVLDPRQGGIEVRGELRVGDVDLLATGPGSVSKRVGMVFQDHALFDDLSAEDNLYFAIDHRQPRGADPRREAQALLDDFGLAQLPHVRAMSGGQRQRLAVARTLAQDPEIIIYDEPTTGLDVDNAERVAARIAKTHHDHSKTSVVVTHDYPTLLPIATRILLIDSVAACVREVTPAEVAPAMHAAGATRQSTTVARPPPAVRPLRALLHTTVDVVAGLLCYLVSLVPRWPRLRWGLRFLVGQLRLVTFVSAMAYMAVAGVILGVVSTYFTFEYLPQRRYTEALITDEILAGLGYLLWRVLAPVLCTILIAARCGAAVSADLGNRTYSRQLDAMRSMGIEPRRYLFTAVTFAFLVGAPLLTLIVFALARLTSELVFVYHFPDHTPFYWHLHFHRLLHDSGDLIYRGGWWTLAKVEAAGAGVAAIAYHLGVRPKRSGREVSAGVTGTIIFATLWVLLTHFVFAFLEF